MSEWKRNENGINSDECAEEIKEEIMIRIVELRFTPDPNGVQSSSHPQLIGSICGNEGPSPLAEVGEETPRVLYPMLPPKAPRA